MKVIFLSNYLTHHQLPFCREMNRLLGDDFLFLATNQMDEERIKMGWELDISGYSFAHFYDDNWEEYEKELLQCEVVICGGTHHMYIRNRLEMGKFTFRYFERIYKTGRIHAFSLKSYWHKLKEHTRYRKKPVYLLCAGAYVPLDFHLFFSYPGKMLKWGYFPEFMEYEEEAFDGKNIREILWTGRMLGWKHPEDALWLAKELKKKQISFHLTMIGEGEKREFVQELIDKWHLQQEVTLHDFVAPSEVRRFMERSGIYLMTSDEQEGWGAVVNEAMNSGCSVVANKRAGCVPYLLKDGANGMVYGSRQELLAKTVELLQKPDLQKQLAKRAYRTIADKWNANVAARRFLTFCENYLDGREVFFETDLLSQAKVIRW
ncbi:MAG: glycosyltransferase family 4 protein [Lachnospiraceae bacterium]